MACDLHGSAIVVALIIDLVEEASLASLPVKVLLQNILLHATDPRECVMIDDE